MKLLVCGSRGWKDSRPIEAIIAGYDTLADETGESLVVIHGDAPQGADRTANTVARSRGIKIIKEPADWDQYGKAAGPIRNQKMLDDHKPDAVFAFRAYGKSNGTDDMCQRAEKAGIPVFVVAGGEHPTGRRRVNA